MLNTIKTKINNILLQDNFTNTFLLDSVLLENHEVYCTIRANTKTIDLAQILKNQIIESCKREFPQINIYINFITHKHSNAVNTVTKYKNKTVKNIIAISSGKGGVGKSTLTINLAYALKSLGYKIGIVDADIYGPSIDFALKGSPANNLHTNQYPIPPYIGNGILYSSVSNFLKNKDSAILLKSPMINKTFTQMMTEINWDNCNFLLIDLPPGTGDLHMHIITKYENINVLMICTSQEIAIIDALKSIDMYKKNNIPIIAMIENMSSFLCTNCNTMHDIFNTNQLAQVCKNHSVPLLANLPIDIQLRKATDLAENLIQKNPENISAKIFVEIANHIINKLNN